MIQNIKFRKVKCPFQRKLSSDIQTNIKNSNNLLLPADKTSNFYKMVSNTYNILLTLSNKKLVMHACARSAKQKYASI